MLGGVAPKAKISNMFLSPGFSFFPSSRQALAKREVLSTYEAWEEILAMQMDLEEDGHMWEEPISSTWV